MSYWTYVHGSILVDTCSRSTPETLYTVQTVLNHLPRISGSEGPAKFYPILLDGHSRSSTHDEFERLSNLGDRRNSRYGWFETQTHCFIALHGELRDRMLEQTLRETTKALSRLSSRLWVEECLITVNGFDKDFLFNNPEWLRGNYDSKWTSDLLWKFKDEERTV